MRTLVKTALGALGICSAHGSAHGSAGASPSRIAAIIVGVLIGGTTVNVNAEPFAHQRLADEAQRAFDLGVENQSRPLLARKHFSDAANTYLELHKAGARDPSLYLNLGNAAVLADRWPEALWAYHVGLKLDPNDARLREHREFVRAKVLLPTDGLGHNEAERWPAWLYRPSFNQFAIGAALAYTLAWLAGTIAFLRRSGWLALLAVAAIVLAGSASFGAWDAFCQAETDRRMPLVILANNTPLYRGNGAHYPPHKDIALLPRGMEARQLHRRGGWLQIRLSTNEIGWIPANRALIVEPYNE